MQTRRNETWFMSHRSFGCTGEQVNKLPLIRGLDVEDIDKGDNLAAR